MAASDDLLNQAAQIRESAPTPTASASDAFLDELAGEQKRQLSTTLDAAIKTHPDKAAEAKRLSASFGLDPVSVENNQEELSRLNRLKELQALMQESPILAQQMTDPRFAALAHDDAENLGEIERLVGAFKRGFTSNQRGGDAQRMTQAAEMLSVIDRLERGEQVTGIPFTPEDMNKPFFHIGDTVVGQSKSNLAKARAFYEAQMSENAVDFTERSAKLAAMPVTPEYQQFNETEGFWDALKSLSKSPYTITSEVVAESTGGQATTLPLIVGGGFAAGAKGLAATTGMSSFNVEYVNSLSDILTQSGIDVNNKEQVQSFVASPEFQEKNRQALIKAGVIGAVDAATAGAAGVSMGDTALKNLLAQTGVQMAGGATGEVAGSVASGQDVKASSVLAEMIGELPGGVKDVSILTARNYLERSMQAKKSAQETAQIEQLNKLAQASALAKNDPESFQQFIDAAAETGPVQNVYIDAKTLMQSGLGGLLMQSSPAVAEQIDKAIATGGQVAIPLGEYAAKIATLPEADQLLDHLKTDPGGFSRAEANDFMANQAQELQADMERQLADKQGDDEFKASQERVKQQLLEQMNAASRFTAQKNEADATLVSSYAAVRASKLGLTPEEFFAKHMLKVNAEMPAGVQVLNQAQSRMVGPATAWQEHYAKIGEELGLSPEQVAAVAQQPDTDPLTGLYTDHELLPAIERAQKSGENFAYLESDTFNLGGMNKALGANSRTDAVLKQIADAYKAAFPDALVFRRKAGRFAVIAPQGYDTASAQKKLAKAMKQIAKANKLTDIPAPKVAGAKGIGLYSGQGTISADATLDEIIGGAQQQIKAAMPQGAEDVNRSEAFKAWLAESTGQAGRVAQSVAGEGGQVRSAGSRGESTASLERAATQKLTEGAHSPELLRQQAHDTKAQAAKLTKEQAARFNPTTHRDTLTGLYTDRDRRPTLERAQQFVEEGGEAAYFVADISNLGGMTEALGLEVADIIFKNMAHIVAENAATTGELVPFRHGGDEISGVVFGVSPEALQQALNNASAEVQGYIQALGLQDLPHAKYLGDTSKYGSGIYIGVKPVEDTTTSIDDLMDASDALVELGKEQPKPEAVPVELNQAYEQAYNKEARGAFNPETNTITLLKAADLSTFLHESGHYFFETDIAIASDLAAQAKAFGIESLREGEREILRDVSALLKWHGIEGDIDSQLTQWHTMSFDEKRSHHERTAESFEAYLFEGKAPSLELQPYFQKFRAWLMSVYRTLKSFLAKHPEAGNLTDEVRGVFDRMLATNEQIQVAEMGRSMLPLFTTPEQSGMTPQEFAAYQAMGVDATNSAIQELQAKGLRDMQWLHNARGRMVKKLQRESKARRREVQIEARREIMGQPVYRAWRFLTGKMTAADKPADLRPKSDPDVLDPTRDSLFVAIAKLGGISKDDVISTWGIDPADKPQSGLFGKPVWRLEGGKSIDGMVELLIENGYLSPDEHGKGDVSELEDRFSAELRGENQYSVTYQPEEEALPGEGVNEQNVGAGRLDLASVLEILGGQPVDNAEVVQPDLLNQSSPVDARAEGDQIIERLVALKMVRSNGIHPDIVADMFGFTSGDQMMRELAAAKDPKTAIEELTDSLMLQQYGELATSEAIEQAADMAIHNDIRARFVTTEANALAKATGKPRILEAAAKEFARNIIARLKVRDIRPSQYASSEVRAAKAAEKASKAGKLVEAAAEKRNQAINVWLTKYAYESQEEVAKGVRYLKKFSKEGARKKIDVEYIDQIDALLERFDLRQASNKAIDKRIAFGKWLEAQREAGNEPDIPPELENEANRKHYKEMTVEEFRGLLDTVKQIEHMGRLKQKLLTAQDQREFNAIADEVTASIVEHGGEARPVELEAPKGLKPWLEGFWAGHRKLASLIRQMDGGQDNGPLWRILGRSMNEAATAESVMNEQATERLAAIYKPLLAMKGGLNGDKISIPEINGSLTRAGRLAVALNWGNEANRARVMEGDNWSQQQVGAILKKLTKQEWQFVNEMWAYIDSYWPQIEAKEKRLTGRAPEKVKAEPFAVTVDGETIQMTGGYYPIKYDSNRSERSEQQEAAQVAEEMKRGVFTRATTRRGHTKERLKSVKRPVRKSLDVITQHISEVTHDLAWHEWLIDANRILGSKRISGAIRDHYGAEVLHTMKDALTGIATADIVPMTKVDQALLYLRANVSRSTMGFSLTTAFLQPFGLTQSMARIGVKPVLRGMARWAGDAARLESSVKWITEKSDFMRLRNKTFNRELHEIKGRVSKGHSQARVIYDASLFMLMQKMQMVADVPTWLGAYEKAKAENFDEETAIAMADQAVLDSQGGGQTKDMSEFQRKHPFLTMFYSYFNTTLNLVAESTAKTSFTNPLAVAGWAADMALLLVIPALAPAMLLMMMRGEECGDAEECAKKLAKAEAGYLLNMMIGVRELSGPASGYDYAGPPIGRVITEMQRTGAQVAQGEADEALATSAVNLLGVSLGIPTTQIMRSWRGWKAWEDGDAPGTSVLLGPPPRD